MQAFSVLRSFLSAPANKQDGQIILHRGMGGVTVAGNVGVHIAYLRKKNKNEI